MSAFKRRAPAASAPDASQNVANRPKGTKVSAYNGSLLLSTGLASLDDILGGGLPLGSLCLLHQDLISTYSKLVLKFFTAQGLVSGQTCALWSDEADITEQLPGLDTPTSKPSSSSQNELTSHDMKIAFNYANLGKFQRSVENEPPQPGPSSFLHFCAPCVQR